ncbi:MAG: carboxypeptidase-like regulatory domain-containing protein, partial [Candidatus Bathyarchaeia archaeon]
MKGGNVRKPSMLLPLLFVTLILNLTFMAGLVQVLGDVAEVSPGKIPPQGRNLYLDGTNETLVKVEFSKGIVLQETVGDLFFNITTQARRRTIAVYIPPEFTINRDLTYVWTSVTNDYNYVSLSTLSNRDPIAPNWQRILVSNGTGGIAPGSHFIRVFNVSAPSIVGQYFFKIYVDGASIGAKNFPTVVVSADPNPAYISGTVLDGSTDPLRYGHPVKLEEPEGGRVVAEGITPEGRIVIAQAFFNASAEGRYSLYGLAAGTYRLTASAAGYYNSTRPDPVT